MEACEQQTQSRQLDNNTQFGKTQKKERGEESRTTQLYIKKILNTYNALIEHCLFKPLTVGRGSTQLLTSTLMLISEL